MKLIVLVLLGIAAVSALQIGDGEQTFTDWMTKFEKKYSPEVFLHRFEVFFENLHFIKSFNANPDATYELGLNAFSDLTPAEHKARLGYRHRDTPYMRFKNTKHHYDDQGVAPSAVNWTELGAVSSVKDQGQCGSCWAFSAVGALEGLYAIQHNVSADKNQFSIQELVDCSKKQGNDGCNGGMMDYAFEYVKKQKGLSSDSYAYTGEDGTCKAKRYTSTKKGPIKGYVDVKAGSETALLEAVNKGPVSVAIEADAQVFQFYSSGVLDDARCGTNLDHGVLLVGYGTEPSNKGGKNKGKDYWLVKNSWGTSWGSHGYIKLARGKNTCGILDSASYPTTTAPKSAPEDDDSDDTEVEPSIAVS